MPESATQHGWHVRRFEELAAIVNDRIDNPSEAGVGRYVGLEHIDPNSLTIRRWGSPSDVEATKLRFHAGDIIFGRRRAYQRKLAVAHFDGICSAHAMVLRARPAVVLPEFLPFLMQSDAFMERAKEISVGSLSPTINWKTLAKETFALPPLDEQRRIADLLLALTAQLDASTRGLDAARSLASSLDEALTAGHGPRATRRLAEVLNLSIDFRGRTPRKLGMDWGGDIPALSAMNVQMGRIDLSRETNFGSDALYKRWMTRGDLRADDVLFTTEAPLGNVCLVPDDRRYILSQRVVALRADPSRIRPAFLASAMRSASFKQEMLQRATGTTATGIRVVSLMEIPISVPSPVVQDEAVRTIDEAERTIAALEQRAAAMRTLKVTALTATLRGDT